MRPSQSMRVDVFAIAVFSIHLPYAFGNLPSIASNALSPRLAYSCISQVIKAWIVIRSPAARDFTLDHSSGSILRNMNVGTLVLVSHEIARIGVCIDQIGT